MPRGSQVRPIRAWLGRIELIGWGLASIEGCLQAGRWEFGVLDRGGWPIGVARRGIRAGRGVRGAFRVIGSARDL